ncbi:head GIN domain-containing protein [Protaetiibacter larvae]|uniref:DUF2807 domain-containing protein n=1 Tax=Protaetiibacter larvae TaxID=2592654 RepID=A0A5C1Y5N9_9MICO|nr:head GIN domain-containing protein [Protaetiibacter larvae]QEO09214.1 DUF2807 domain-containing protein [Protaetiibacter larvae]
MNTTTRGRRGRRIALAAGVGVVGATLLAGCLPVPRIAFPPEALGELATEQHAVSDEVHALRLETGGSVDVVLGDEPGLTIRGPQGILDRLTVDESNGTLVLGSTGGAGWLGELLRYTLTVTSLDTVELSGSGDVRADLSAADVVTIRVDGSGDVTGTGVAADSVDVELSGSGDVRLAGQADTATLRVSGSGDLSAGALRLVDALAEVDGSGDLTVHASGELDASVSGSGDILVRGNPRVTREISGSGDIVGA